MKRKFLFDYKKTLHLNVIYLAFFGKYFLLSQNFSVKNLIIKFHIIMQFIYFHIIEKSNSKNSKFLIDGFFILE